VASFSHFFGHERLLDAGMMEKLDLFLGVRSRLDTVDTNNHYTAISLMERQHSELWSSSTCFHRSIETHFTELRNAALTIRDEKRKRRYQIFQQ
jgi:hypothetical protein